MSFSQKLLDAADVAESVLAGVSLIERVTDKPLPGGSDAALAAIGSIVKAIKPALHGEASGQDVLAQLNTIRAQLTTGLADAAADSELDKKFPTG